MNKYLRAAICVGCGTIKTTVTKLFHPRAFQASPLCMISPFTELTVEYGAKLVIGRRFKMRDGAKIRVRKGGVCTIGSHTSVNSYNFIVCRERIAIGDYCQLAPGVQIYDHDHDFLDAGGITSMRYRTSPVIIGNHVLIGANTVILRGSRIGDHCVIAAGSVVTGVIPPHTTFIQKRTAAIRPIERERTDDV